MNDERRVDQDKRDGLLGLAIVLVILFIVYGGFVGFGQPGWFMPDARSLNKALSEEFAESLGQTHSVTAVDFKSCNRGSFVGLCYPEYTFLVETGSGEEITETRRLDSEMVEERFVRTKRIKFNIQDGRILMKWRYEKGLGKSTRRMLDGGSDSFNTYDESGVYEEARAILERVREDVTTGTPYSR